MSNETYRVCCCFRRRFKMAVAEPPADIKAIFKDYSDNGVMSVDQLRQFLVEVQNEENTPLEDAQAVMDRLNEAKPLNIFSKRGINLDAFFKYLFGIENPPLNPKQRIHHDMNLPLSHYFIYTGHNSYLTGNQLSSDCSDVPIINALRNGVRVIELDIWPNSDKDNINVLHGRTLTAPVLFIQCLRSIREHAFVASDYPVVITLEDHLTPDLQAKAAEMLTETFGDMLFTPSECLSEFPSPEALKRRILISTKPPQEYTEEDSDGDDDEEDPESEAPEYRRLIAIHAGKGPGGMKEWLSVDPNKVRRLSLSELELEKNAGTYALELVKFTQRNILRVYPKGTRINSSNYDPMIGWTHGAQMVAFNMQGYGKSLWLMHAMFRANGGCGYVKKPDFLLNSGSVFTPKASMPVKTTLRVTVYMGEGWYNDFDRTHFDSYSPPDFYVRVGIAGLPFDDTGMKRTKTMEDNWIPNWDEVFEFLLTAPELAILRIEVCEHDRSNNDDFAGQTCLPVSELRSGIRAVPLHSETGERYKSVRLLMRFEFF